ncbi:ATP-grasp fold amidoligase family protein [Nesterenkonia sp.]|uniref:ATP-grasp fold amidoligase family protein n=1 Tax=Nesterenkonia sp. TaxID=704201 RepID=UPI00261E03AE|nr:ATP-grasp fold amidoligase family protein [Nesterenkonia sp.]
MGEWPYTQAERTLLIEPRLGDGVPLNDYKLYVFHGEVKLLHVDTGRFSGTFGEQFCLPDFTPVGIVNNAPPPQQPLHAPESLATMVAAAAVIAADFDFMRVDFYEVDGRPWFGELTPYPSGGMDPFEPEWVDHMMGAWWSRRPFNRTPLEQVQLI